MKKTLSIVISIIFCVTMMLPLQACADNTTETYVINGRTIPLAGYEVGKPWDNCWTFARQVYYEIWGTMDGKNILEDISDLSITEENTKRFIESAELGSNIRVEDGKDINRHSLILVQKDNNGFTVYHGNYNSQISITYYTYKEFARDYKNYKNFVYITSPDKISVIVNGNQITFDQQPIISNERTLVPLRAIFEALSATVDWNGETQTVTSTRGNISVSLTINSKKMTKNGKEITLDVPSYLIGNRTLVPVRAIAEAFNCNVDWNGETQTVTINDKPEQEEQPTISELNHTYTTQYGTVNAVTCPKFSFDYSDNWTITKEDVVKGWQQGFLENVVLQNNRGVTINYVSFGQLDGNGKNMNKYEVSKASDSQFVAGYASGGDTDYSYLGKIMVGRIEVTGELFMGIDDDYKPVSGKESYAVMPESYIGTHEATGLTGYYEEFSSDYGGYLLYAEAPDGSFTEEEKQEVIQILSTFRVE